MVKVDLGNAVAEATAAAGATAKVAAAAAAAAADTEAKESTAAAVVERKTPASAESARFFLRGIEKLGEHHLKDHFARFADVLEATLVRDKKTQRPRGMAF